MYAVSICIPTYKRPELIERLITSIGSCNLDPALIGKILIVVVDNDADRSAAAKVAELSTRLAGKITIDYHSYAIKGLASVRNELIRQAFKNKPDFIVFVDDDEYVCTDWLNALVKTIINNNADMVMGPVTAVFEHQTPEHITTWFARGRHPDNARLDYIRTGNLIINAAFLSRLNIWFDERFNKTGSEDTYFGNEMIKKGASIYWAAQAKVYEITPPSRTNIRWLFNRRYRVANTFTYMLKIDKLHAQVFKKALVSIVYLILGAATAVFAIIPFRKRNWGLLKIAEGAGGLSALFDIAFNEYH